MSDDAAQDEALLALLAGLDALGYRFVTVTPETHRRFLAKQAGPKAGDLRDVFGWSRPFDPGLLPPPIRAALEQSGMAERTGDLWKSKVRVSSIGELLFLHGAYPTDGADAVFLGPDSDRFAALLRSEMPRLGPVGRLVDIGAGAGVGAIVAAGMAPGALLTLTDVNPKALRFARVNARHAGLAVETVEGEGLDKVAGPIDLVIANPPFVMDSAKRAYRDGGDMHGAALSRDWAVAAAGRIAPGGAILLYTGSAIVAGRDALRASLEAEMAALGCSLHYRELDPDIFGELIAEPAYRDVERIAAVAAVIRRP